MHHPRSYVYACLGLLGYILVASLYFGWHVIGSFHTHYVGYESDPALFMWMLNWWPFSLLHGLNPLYTDYVWYPLGFSIANTTSIPLYGFALWPITVHFGAQTSYNLLAIYLSALSAWAMYGFAYFLTRQFWPAWASGLVFGFSTYMIGQTMGGHLNLMSIYPIPLLAWISCAYCQQRLSARWSFVWFFFCFVLLVGTSREILAITGCIGCLTVLLSLLCYRDHRIKIVYCVVLAMGAMFCALILYWPYLIAFIKHLHDAKTAYPLSSVGFFWNLVLPSHISLLGQLLPQHFLMRLTPESRIEMTNYMGLLSLIIILYGGLSWKKTRTKPLLLFAWLMSFSLTFGPFVWITTNHLTHILTPEVLFYEMPLLHKIIPARFSVGMWFFLAIMVALWMAEPAKKRWPKYGLIALGMFSILPSFSHNLRPWYSTNPPSQFFRHHTYQHYCPPSDPLWIIAISPHQGQAMLWQLASNMAFKQYYGYVNFMPPNHYPDYGLAWSVLHRHLFFNTSVRLVNFLHAEPVTCLITTPQTVLHWHPLFTKLPAPVYQSHSLIVYRFHPEMHHD